MNLKTLAAVLTASALPALRAEPPELAELPPFEVDASPAARRLPDYSTSSTTFDAEDLARRGAQHLQDTLAAVPNMNFASATSRPRYLQLRGIGERSQFAGEGPPNFSVGFLVDDIDLSGQGMAGALFDLASVEVLRGPQPTAYGSQALAGLINLNSQSPGQPDLLRLSLGSDELYEAGVALGGSVGEAWSWRLALHEFGSDGFRENVFLGRDDTNQRRESTGRLRLRYEPSPLTLVDLTLLGASLRNGYDAFAPRGDGFTTYTDDPGEDSQDLLGASLRARVRLLDDVDLLSITSGSQTRNRYRYDADWGNDAYWAAPPTLVPPGENRFTEDLRRQRQQAQQELRFLGRTPILAGSSQWSAGLAGSWLKEEDAYQGGWSALNSEVETRSAAAYAQLVTRLSGNAQLISSLRLERRQTDYHDDQGIREALADNMTGGRVALEVPLSGSWLLFGNVSRGYKGGGVNQDPAVPAERRRYGPETAWNFELGLRTEWANGRGRADLTAFHMERRDLQITTSLQSDPADPTTFTFFTDNAAEGYNRGLELELVLPLGSSLSAFATLGLLDTEYRNFQDAGGSPRLGGRDQPHAPAYTFQTGLQLVPEQGWFARVELEGKDRFYFGNSHDSRSEPYALLNLSLGYRTPSWSITLWGRNVTDERYDTRGYFFGLEPPDYPEQLWTMSGDPVQFGITWQHNF